jgi:fructokinase
VIAGIELGGTKSIAVLSRRGTIVDRLQVPTLLPEATLAALVDRVAAWHAAAPVDAIGIASFGPLALDPAAPAFGHITVTTKPDWSHTDVRGAFAQAVAVPTGFDTDVAGAALAEGQWGAARGCRDHVYLTIGTGVGAGIVAGGGSSTAPAIPSSAMSASGASRATPSPGRARSTATASKD